MAIQDVLIAVDFSRPSRLAAQAGISLARALCCKAHLIHIAPVLPELEIDSKAASIYNKAVAAEAEEKMARLAKDLEFDGDCTVVSGAAGPRLVEFAKARKPSLIVVGSSGRADNLPLLLGSATAYLARSANCPVLVIRREHADLLPADGCFRQPLVAIDFSRFSERSIQLAAMLSEPESSIELYHALFAPNFELATGDVDKTFEAAFGLYEKKQQARIEKLAKEAATSRSVRAVVEKGRAAELICEHVVANSIDLVVTGAHGRESSADLLIGTVADRLLRSSPAPVLLIPDGAVIGA